VNKRDGFGHEKPGEGITNDWITPRWILDSLGHFDLDPCESNSQPWLCADKGYRLCRGEDGLALPWEGSVYCNPPYGPHTAHWIERCRDHGDVIMLIFARTETRAFWKVWTGMHGILFLKGRVSFFLPDGSKAASGTAPSCLVAFGEAAAERLSGSHLFGAYCENWSVWDETCKEEADDVHANRRKSVVGRVQSVHRLSDAMLRGGRPGVEGDVLAFPAPEEV